MDTPISLLNLICIQNNTKADYTLLSREGQVHLPTFTYQVQVNEHIKEASGQSKKKAKHLAAKKMILSLFDDANIVIKEDRNEILESLKSIDESVDILENNKQNESKLTETKGDNIYTIKENKLTTSVELGNPIGKLQEICMKKHWHPPIYEETESTGLPHERLFTFRCCIENMNLSVCGSGKSKKSAKREAAEKMLAIMRDEHLDKVDDILDRIPKRATFNRDQQEGGFNLRNEIMTFQANRDKNRLMESKLYSYFKQLRSNQDIIGKIKDLVPELKNFITKYFGDAVVENIEDLIPKITEIIKCRLVLVLHPEKSQIDQYQYWAEFISSETPFENLSILSVWGTDDDLQIARHKTLSRLLLLFICLIQDKIQEFNNE